MSFFKHLSDNTITISNGSVTVGFPIVTFLQMEPLYSLPIGLPPYIARHYIPGVFHRLTTSQNTYETGVFPWPDGDYYISKVPQYIDQSSFLNCSLTLKQAKNIRQLAITSYARAIKLGGVNFKNTTFPSENLNANELISYEILAVVPAGFYVLDFLGAEIPFDLNDLQDLNNYTAALRFYANVNAHNLSIAVAALQTVSDVLNFDITTNWPAVPYTPP